MNILLDTHILLWHLADNPKLKPEHSELIEDTANSIFFSVVSLWEIAIKLSIGKLAISQTIDKIVPNEVNILGLKVPHILKVTDLDFHHRDPFDRMIIAQSMAEGIRVMSYDGYFKLYDVDLISSG
ncbi:type II toxin-antitoxin system VapC family toxin [Desulfococcaceae bacterium HSG8]|nr:type II toxin-antitoxin system VapC family toxin [Desulfococcaceae bacterium HSG8]